MEKGGLPAKKASQYKGEENPAFMCNGDQNEI